MSSQSANTPSLALLNGRYRLLAIVANGGMATVYKSQDTLLNRIVAVKMLREQLAQDPQFVQRFREEAQAAANLNHPNIVTVFDVGRDVVNGLERHYIVMEYVEGQDLKQAIRQRALAGRPFGIDEAVEIIRQVCEAVGHAHRRGLVHCDLKPQNVLITPEGKAKVADFGIARAYTALVAERSETVWGTPQYYSPEQATGAIPTPPSDVYSIGVMLYEILAGRLPFEARDPQELARLHLNAEPPELHTLNPNVPLQLEAIVRRALSKDPANRYRDADQLARVFTAYLQQGEEQTLSQPAAATGLTGTGRATAPRQTTSGAALLQPQSQPQPQPQPQPANAPPRASTGGAPRAGLTGARAATSDLAQTSAPADSSTDLWVWLLGALAVLCVLGLIPLYAFVFRTYTAPAPVPAPAGTGGPATPVLTMTVQGAALVLPSFVGMSADQAREQIQVLGLQALVAEERPDPQAAQPRILEQRPAAGERIRKGDAVSLVVGKPAPAQTVPGDLIGRVFDSTLSQTLKTVGWNVAVSETVSFQPENAILAVEPPGGSQLPLSSTLTVTVSTGGRIPLIVDMNPIMLDWVRFNQERYAPGQAVRFDTRWRAVGPVGRSYKVFVHVFGPDGNLVAQPPDREPQNGGVPAPTSTWNAGTVVNDTYVVDMPANAPAGVYRVEVGLYEGQDRLAVQNFGNTPARPKGVNSVLVRAIRVGS